MKTEVKKHRIIARPIKGAGAKSSNISFQYIFLMHPQVPPSQEVIAVVYPKESNVECNVFNHKDILHEKGQNFLMSCKLTKNGSIKKIIKTG